MHTNINQKSKSSAEIKELKEHVNFVAENKPNKMAKPQANRIESQRLQLRLRLWQWQCELMRMLKELNMQHFQIQIVPLPKRGKSQAK